MIRLSVGAVQMSFDFKLKFRGVTNTLFKLLRKKAAQNGIPVCAPSGTATKDGITIEWKYDPTTELLEVGCVHAPFWIDTSRVNRRMYEEIEALLETRTAA